MTDIRTQINKKSDYNVKLDQFEGPLDLLLHLIKDAKLEISEIAISKITEQYLDYLKDIDRIDLEKAGEFIEVAATLLEIKSKALLPKIEEFFKEEENSGKKLVQQIEEYKLFKEASEKLKTLEEVNRFYKEPDKTTDEVKVVLKDMTLDGLLNAFSRLLNRVEVKSKTPVKAIALDRFTVAQKMSEIRQIIDFRKQIQFTELFEADYTKSEIINTFLALLELLKLQVIKVMQETLFSDIILFSAEDMTDGN